MPNPPSDLHEDDLVRIIGGLWKGHRGIIKRKPEESDHLAVVAVEHEDRRGGWSWSSYYVALANMERYHATDTATSS